MGKKTRRRLEEPMTAIALGEWRNRMGYTRRDAIRELGCTREEWADWESGEEDIPRHIGLACAALALGMKPFGQEQV